MTRFAIIANYLEESGFFFAAFLGRLALGRRLAGRLCFRLRRFWLRRFGGFLTQGGVAVIGRNSYAAVDHV